MRITIGHPAYARTSANHYAVHHNKYDTLCDLIARGVDGKVAIAKVDEAVAHKGRTVFVDVSGRPHYFIEIKRVE